MLARSPFQSGKLIIALKRCRTSCDAGPHSASGSKLLAGSESALSPVFFTFERV
jgi:hypothetical protein